MENYKKILLFIVILIISIIIITFILLMLRKEEILKQENPPTIAFQNIEKVNNKTLFFQIENLINRYINYNIQNNEQAVKALSPSGTLNISKIYNTFISNQMYAIDKINNITVFVEQLARQNSTQEYYYFIVNIDYANNTYEIIISSKQEFENAKNNSINEKYKKDISIQNNRYNEIKDTNITDFQVLKKYFEDYKYKAINTPEVAFNILDAEYRKVKFNNNLEQYKTYIQNNINNLQDANIVKHGINKEEAYNKYTFIDNYGNYYKLTETGIYEYTIILDNYTILTDEQIATYNNLTNEEKAVSNIDKVMKLINQKDYITVYNYLNEEFKNKNFPKIEIFTKYVKENFFENNIMGKIVTKTEGNVFVLKVPFKESLSTAAQNKEKTFIMKLNEGTNFEISFEV